VTIFSSVGSISFASTLAGRFSSELKRFPTNETTENLNENDKGKVTALALIDLSADCDVRDLEILLFL